MVILGYIKTQCRFLYFKGDSASIWYTKENGLLLVVALRAVLVDHETLSNLCPTYPLLLLTVFLKCWSMFCSRISLDHWLDVYMVWNVKVWCLVSEKRMRHFGRWTTTHYRLLSHMENQIYILCFYRWTSICHSLVFMLVFQP